MALIWTCPTCDEDLHDEYWHLYCDRCAREVSWYEFAGLDDEDDRRDFLTAEYADER